MKQILVSIGPGKIVIACSFGMHVMICSNAKRVIFEFISRCFLLTSQLADYIDIALVYKFCAFSKGALVRKAWWIGEPWASPHRALLHFVWRCSHVSHVNMVWHGIGVNTSFGR